VSSRKWKGAKQGVAGNCCHQQNSATRKIWLPVEQRQNQKNLATDAKIGPDERKWKGAKVLQEFATNTIWCQDSKF
jgi:hypothetical protein